MAVQFCPYCGMSLSGIDAAFCPRCGRQLPSTLAPGEGGSAPVQPPQPQSGGAYPPPAPSSAPSAPLYAGSQRYAPAPYAAMVPQYMQLPSAGPVTLGRATGVTATVAAIVFVLVLLASFPFALRIFGYRYAIFLLEHALSTLGVSSAWALCGVFWLAIARLPRYSWGRVAAECVVVSLIALLLLPVLNDLIALALIGDRSFIQPFVWLLQMPPIKLVLIVLFSAATAFTAAGLAAGFASWSRLRAARIPVSAAASLLVPIGAVVGVFVCIAVLYGLLARIATGLGAGLVAGLLFDALPLVVLAIAAGMITYTSLRDKVRTASAPAPAPYPPAPPSGPVPR